VHAQAVWFLVGAAMLWSLGGLLIKWVDWYPLAIASARSAIAAATMALLLPRARFTAAADPGAIRGSQAGQLAALGPPETVRAENGAALLTFTLPRRGVSLLVLEWGHPPTN